MLKVQEIRELIKLVDQSSLDELIFEENGTKLKLRKNRGQVVSGDKLQQVPAVQETVPTSVVKEDLPKVETKQENVQTNEKGSVNDESLHKIVSPMVGTFYSAPSPEDSDYVKVGDKVGVESIVCIVEAMKLFNEIEAEVNGEIVEVLVENGQLVEYGQPLFLVKPE